MVVCCTAGDEPGGLGLEEMRKSEDQNIAKLLGWLVRLPAVAGWFPENSCKSWQLRQRDRVVVVVREPVDLCDLLEMWAERKGGHTRWSVTEPG